MVLFDTFGLFKFRIRMNRDIFALTLFNPNTFNVETQIAYGENANLDSDEFSMKKRDWILRKRLLSGITSPVTESARYTETDGEIR